MRRFQVLPVECLTRASQPNKEETVAVTIGQIGKLRQPMLFLVQNPIISKSEGGI